MASEGTNGNRAPTKKDHNARHNKSDPGKTRSVSFTKNTKEALTIPANTS